MFISVSSGFKSLRMHTQGCQGCQKTRNFVRNSKILIDRSTIQPKLNKIKNHLPSFDEFWYICYCFFDFTQFWLNGRPGNEYFIISHKISGLLTPLRVHPQWFETDLRHSSYIAIKGCAMIDLIDEFQSTNARKCLQQKNYELWGSLGSQVCWHSTVVIR